MGRVIFNILSFCSLLLCLLLLAGWVFSRALGSCGAARYSRVVAAMPDKTPAPASGATLRADELTINNGRLVWAVDYWGGVDKPQSGASWRVEGSSLPTDWDYGVHHAQPYVTGFGNGLEEQYYGCSLGRYRGTATGTLPISGWRITLPCLFCVAPFAVLPLLWVHRSNRARKKRGEAVAPAAV